MEKRTIYRITGILAVVGLAVVLLPLFMDNEEAPTLSPSIVQAPAFPDQATTDPTQVTENSEPQATQNVLPVNQNAQPSALTQTNENNTNAVTKNPEAANTISPAPVMPSTENNPMATADNAPEAPTPDTQPGIVNAPESTSTQQQTKASEAPAPKKREASIENARDSERVEVTKKSSMKKIASVKKGADKKALSRTSTPTKVARQKLTPIQALTPETDQGLLSLKKSAWVIQIGSFKSKSNAIKMANHLRANGYNAFMQDMTSSFGPSTRVFIGPEYKQSSATALVKQLEAELHLHGIVVSYNPLVL